jgi:hypothetical protein
MCGLFKDLMCPYPYNFTAPIAELSQLTGPQYCLGWETALIPRFRMSGMLSPFPLHAFMEGRAQMPRINTGYVHIQG